MQVNSMFRIDVRAWFVSPHRVGMTYISEIVGFGLVGRTELVCGDFGKFLVLVDNIPSPIH